MLAPPRQASYLTSYGPDKHGVSGIVGNRVQIIRYGDKVTTIITGPLHNRGAGAGELVNIRHRGFPFVNTLVDFFCFVPYKIGQIRTNGGKLRGAQ